MSGGFKFADKLSDEIKQKRIEVIKDLILKGERENAVYFRALSEAGIPKVSIGKLAQLKRHIRWMTENGK